MNPVLNKKTFSNLSYEQESMTINGVVNKSFILWLVLAVGAYFGWAYPAVTVPLIIPAILVALVLSIIVVFKKTTVPVISPIYAFCEGLVLGAITLLFEKDYPGIAFNAIFLTITVLFCMLAAFKAGFIKATGKFRLMVAVSTIAICLLYVIELILSLCGVTGITFITASTPLGIAFSVFVVIIASLNLIIDFDMIEQGVSAGAPKYMEWYGAFALMITIVWLYLEILRLLSKIRN